MNRLGLGLAIVLLSLIAGCQTVGQYRPGLSNFDTVEPGQAGIYRGAQPTPKGILALRDQGVQTIINLRDDPADYEQHDVEGCGMKYVSIKSDAAHVRPTEIRAFLDALQSMPRPIFVHCAFGRDRTGLEIGVYRIVVEHWSREKAIAELRAHGFNWFLYPGIEHFLGSFDVAQFSSSGGSIAQTTASAAGAPESKIGG